MKLSLTSTAETQLTADGQLARFWYGQTEDGVPVAALIVLAAVVEDGADFNPAVLERVANALGQHIESKAEITIPDVVARKRLEER